MDQGLTQTIHGLEQEVADTNQRMKAITDKEFRLLDKAKIKEYTFVTSS